MYADSDFDADFLSSGNLAHLTLAECVQRLGDPRLPEAERAGLLCRLGWWQLQDGQLEGAIAQFDQVLLLRPDLVAAYHGRARALDGLGRFQEAIANYDQAVKLAAAPGAMLWRDRGCTLRSLGRYGEALTSYGKALERRPQDALSMSAKGSLLAVLRRQKRAAMQLCDRALQLDPNLPEAWNSKGVVHSVAGQYAEAQQCYERAIALDNRLDRAWSNRGIAMLRQDRVLEAIANFEQALSLAPHRQEAWKAATWAHQGRALMKLGRYDRAIASFDEALRLQRGYAPAALNRLLSLGVTDKLGGELRQAETRRALLENVGAVLNAAKLRLALVLGAVLLLSLGQGPAAEMLRQGVSVLLSLGVLGLIVADLWRQRSRLGFVWQTYFGTHWLTYGRALGIVVATLVTYSVADAIAPPFLRWGWSDLVFGRPGNVIFQPFNLIKDAAPSPPPVTDLPATPMPGLESPPPIPEAVSQFNWATLLILLFWLLLLLGIPFWARLEERLFRRGANTWRQIGVRSTWFGLAHLLAGIPILGGLVLILPGFLFACRYKYVRDRHLQKTGNAFQSEEAGVRASTADHAAYNAILITIAAAVLIFL
ncbi:MAG: hypothetical protein OHK0037_28040 [Elainellaceae cyanobacterium]